MRTAIPRRFGFATCFVCGPDNARGLHLIFERDGDAVVTTYTAPADFAGYGTILHGGFTSMLLDEAMAWAVYGVLGKLSMTTELRVRLHGSVRCGDALTISGRIASNDDREAAATAEIRDSGGVVRADGTGTMRFVTEGAARRLSRGV